MERTKFGMMPVYTLAEVQKHSTLQDPWIIIQDFRIPAFHYVHDLTNYQHPGGLKALEPYLGRDASPFFYGKEGLHPHSEEALVELSKFRVGVLDCDVVSSPRFDHIAFSVHDANDTLPFLVQTLGGKEFDAFVSPPMEFQGGQLKFQKGERLEIIQPTAESSFLTRFLARGGPGVHHTTFKVPSLGAAAKKVTDMGFTITGFTPDETISWREFFIHPSQLQGLVVQIVEEKPDMTRPSLEWNSNFPNAKLKPAEEPVNIYGLHVTFPSPDVPMKIWGDLLQGQVEKTANQLTFSWPGSPLRIVVSINGAPNAQLGINHVIAFAGPQHPAHKAATNGILKSPLLGTPFVLLSPTSKI